MKTKKEKYMKTKEDEKQWWKPLKFCGLVNAKSILGEEK